MYFYTPENAREPFQGYWNETLSKTGLIRLNATKDF